MAGVVAMASVIEDFDTQPCKKPRKDDGSPTVKTITNYFAPVVKPVEKPFSPPRSNNIMDYFNRRPPSSKEKTSPSAQTKENCQTSLSSEKNPSIEAAVKQPLQKRGRKAIKATRKLVESENVASTAEICCLTVDDPHQSKEFEADVTRCCGILGSDTAGLLAELSADACMTTGSATITVSDGQADKDEDCENGQADKDEDCENGSKSVDSVQLQPELKTTHLSSDVLLADKAKQNKPTTQNSKRRHQEETKQSEPEGKRAEPTLCDVSMEVNVDKALQSSHSTVTISFEDFVRSQSQDECEDEVEEIEGAEKDSKIITEVEEMDSDQLKNLGSEEPILQVSPRTVTFQAEVHAVSPKQEAVKTVGKLASIFNKRKEAVSPAEAAPSPQTEAGHQLPSSPLTVRRKSNVVLEEEDLELAVLESESTAKCSEAERKQFMAAFKRPSLDGAKAKPGKTQGKSKQPGEKNVEGIDVFPEENSIISTVDHVSAASPENKVGLKKVARKGRKKTKDVNKTIATSLDAADPPPTEETLASIVDSHDEKVEHAIPALRRSRREAAVRQTPDTTTANPIRKNKKKNVSEDPVAALPDSPVNMSTPKTRKSKHGIFVAEMVCQPDTKGSPIRIKFTRVHRNVPVSKSENGNCINTTMPTKMSENQSKKRNQAKKLVEKARVIQQSKKSAVEDKVTVRRSSRNEASIKKSYCENEDSVICLEDDLPTPQTAPEKGKKKKHLRSLNDVLGKATSGAKETKALPGSKAALLGQEKSARKASAVISIFDESSREGSENSQDEEQFRARREFLKSGLPETFRKQILKTAATKEAYTLSCSSFQPVIHIKQPPKDCPLWSLPWPKFPLLNHLKADWSPTASFPSVSGSLCLKIEPAHRAICERGSGWRPEIAESVRQLLIEEVSTANPAFPVQMFITCLMKRRADHQQHCAASGTALSFGGKRKRIDDEGESTTKLAKKQRANHLEENTLKSESKKRGGRLRRAQRSKSEKEEIGPSYTTSPIPSKDDSVVVLDDVVLVAEAVEKDVVKEDVLWTEKYQPRRSSDIIGNTASVRRLHSWLREWKLRADREERKKQKDKKEEEGSLDSDWDCGDEDSQDIDDTLCNTVLITGPTGIGKTAAVYACAQELGFKVFEVNASSQRSGRLILSQLREATQSHQVDSQGVNAHKPTYFNSYGSSSSTGGLRPGSSPRKVNSPRRVVSSPRKHPQSPRGAKKGALPPKSLVNFFKMGRPIHKEPQSTQKTEQTTATKKVVKANNGIVEKQKDLAVKSPTTATPKGNTEEQSKKMATSLILFEEVDVIFDDDSGFLAAIKTFMTTTKRPVILTTSDPAFRTMFDGNFEEIHFKTPSVLNVGTYLQLLCLAEDVRTDLSNISSLLQLNGCDIRQSLLQLQLWARSGGGCHVTNPLTHTDNNDELKTEIDGKAAGMSVSAVALPPSDSGCTESRLGLLNIEPYRDIWELLRNHSLVETVCWELLMDSRRRGVDLVYSNMEKLLPLPLTQLNTSTHNPDQPVSESQHHPQVNPKELPSSDTQSHARLLHVAESGDCTDDGSPVKVSCRMKKNKRKHSLSRDGEDSDSEDSFVSLCKPQVAHQANEVVKERSVSQMVKRRPLTPGEKVKSLPVSQCLESIADYFDNMSYLDSLLLHPEGGVIHRRMSLVGAVVKDGMTDELRIETDSGRWLRGEQTLQIQAAVEALSFYKCRGSAAAAWDKAQQLEGELRKEAAEELTLPLSPHCVGYSFSQDGPCQPELVQGRREVIDSLMLKGVVGTLGNRPTAALDYLPYLRSICRSEQLKEKGKVKRRFLHYLDAIHLGLEKSTLHHLAEDFP